MRPPKKLEHKAILIKICEQGLASVVRYQVRHLTESLLIRQEHKRSLPIFRYFHDSQMAFRELFFWMIVFKSSKWVRNNGNTRRAFFAPFFRLLHANTHHLNRCNAFGVSLKRKTINSASTVIVCSRQISQLIFIHTYVFSCKGTKKTYLYVLCRVTLNGT